MNMHTLNSSLLLGCAAWFAMQQPAQAAGDTGTSGTSPAATQETRPMAQTRQTLDKLTDSDFVQMAGLASNAEIELSQLALQTSKNARVRYYAEKMVADHTQSAKELKQLASRKGLTVPSGLDEMHRKSADSLARLPNTQFDQAYMDQMIADHEQAVTLFRQQTQTGADDGLRQFAIRMLPHLQEHLRQAREIRSKL